MDRKNQTLHDLKIRGTATASGGTFRRVFIQGEGDVEGNVECNTLRVQGAFRVHGNLNSREIRLMGTAEIEGNCSSEDMKLTGDVVIQGNCNAEKFKSKGGFTIEGLLNAGDIEVSLYGPARVKEIGGERIHVKLPFRIFSSSKLLTVEVIEGDDIHLEYTNAKIVRGNRVWVGMGCEIGLVEYKEDFNQDKKAKVTEAKKI